MCVEEIQISTLSFMLLKGDSSNILNSLQGVNAWLAFPLWLFGLTALIASLVPREGKQAVKTKLGMQAGHSSQAESYKFLQHITALHPPKCVS